MIWLILFLLFLAAPQAPAPARDQRVDRLIDQIATSGRVLTIADSAEQRVSPPLPLAPGEPPLLAFRYFEGQSKHRFGNLDLVMDDAGH